MIRYSQQRAKLCSAGKNILVYKCLNYMIALDKIVTVTVTALKSDSYGRPNYDKYSVNSVNMFRHC